MALKLFVIEYKKKRSDVIDVLTLMTLLQNHHKSITIFMNELRLESISFICINHIIVIT